MKKLLVGCLIVLVLGGVVAAIAGFYLYRAASGVVENARTYLEGLNELGEIEKQIANRSDYAAPASGELTDAQVERFARVQDGVRTALGQRFDEIDKKYEHLKSTTDGQQPSIGEVLGALRDITALFVEARRFQVAALNQEQFSQEEYDWVRTRVFEAAGMEVTAMVDWKQLQDSIQRGTGIENIGTPNVPAPDVPEKNRALVKPYLPRMDQWVPLAFFGL